MHAMNAIISQSTANKIWAQASMETNPDFSRASRRSKLRRPITPRGLWATLLGEGHSNLLVPCHGNWGGYESWVNIIKKKKRQIDQHGVNYD